MKASRIVLRCVVPWMMLLMMHQPHLHHPWPWRLDRCNPRPGPGPTNMWLRLMAKGSPQVVQDRMRMGSQSYTCTPRVHAHGVQREETACCQVALQ